MKPSERIVVNTIILYSKLLITIVVNLYATRLILLSLGVEDYGIVNLISGIVAMLSFVQNSMTVSTQRYLSVKIGEKDIAGQSEVFNTSFILHISLAIIILVILECCYPLVFNSTVNIPEHRIASAQILYQLMIAGTALVVVTVPFDATLNAHENMLWFSIASIIESLIRLAGAIMLISYSHDKLIFYGFLIIAIRLASMIVKVTYCELHYVDSRLSLNKCRRSLIREMFAFSFWNLFGAFASAVRGQGIAVVLNIFRGITINAAYGIAHQVSGQLSNFSATITKAMAPQIMQSKGAGEEQKMITKSLKQSKFTFALMSMFALPLLIDTDYILALWLKDVPPDAAIFCKLIILVAMVTQLSSGLMTLIQANGKINSYQVTMSAIILLSIPLAILVLWLGFPGYYVIIVMLAIEMICFIIRLLFAHRLVGLSLNYAMRELCVPVLFLSLSGAIAYYLISSFCTLVEYNSLFVFIVHLMLSEIVVFTVVVLCVLTQQEKLLIKQMLQHTFQKNKH